MPGDDDSVSWPASRLCRLYRVGRATQADRAFERVHTTPDLIVHLYAVAARVRMGGQEYAVQPGDLTVTPPDTDERFAFTRNGLHWFVRLIPEPATGAGLRLARHYHLAQRSIEARRRIESIARDFRLAAGDPEHPAAWAAAAGAHALLCWLAAIDGAAAAPSSADICVAKAAAILRSQESAALPIAEVAHRAGMSQNRLAQAFLARHGMSMTAYRAVQMIESAKWLMESTDLPMSAIRKRIEIADAQRFNKLFRRVTGLSPRDWLAEHDPVRVSSPRPPVPARRKG